SEAYAPTPRIQSALTHGSSTAIATAPRGFGPDAASKASRNCSAYDGAAASAGGTARSPSLLRVWRNRSQARHRLTRGRRHPLVDPDAINSDPVEDLVDAAWGRGHRPPAGGSVAEEP